MRLLWVLLHPRSSAYLLLIGVSTRDWLCVCNTTPSIPAPKSSSVPCSYVCWPWSIIYHPDRSWSNTVRLGDPDLENESGLDGSYDYFQHYGWSVVCTTGKLSCPVLISCSWAIAKCSTSDSREMVSLSLRCLGSKSSDHALFGDLCRYRAFIWSDTSF